MSFNRIDILTEGNKGKPRMDWMREKPYFGRFLINFVILRSLL
jgi:hypothetical protein